MSSYTKKIDKSSISWKNKKIKNKLRNEEMQKIIYANQLVRDAKEIAEYQQKMFFYFKIFLGLLFIFLLIYFGPK